MSIAPTSLRSFRRARTLRRAAIAGATAAAAVLMSAGPALAHITVNPGSAPAGGAAELTFRVPNEEANADTVKVDVQIPTDHPIAQFLVKPVPGWTVSVRTIKLAKPVVTNDGAFSQAVSEVIWSGGKILPGQFQDFSVSANPLPTGISQMTFKAIQTYSNGDVVRWIDLSQPGQPPPAHPAPVLTLTTTSAPATGAPAARAAAPASSSSNGIALTLAALGLVVALLASLLALTATRSVKRRTIASDPAGPVDSERVLAGSKTADRRDQAPAGRSQNRRRG